MSKHYFILFLVIFAGVCPSQVNCWCKSDAVLIGGAAVVGAAAAPFVVSAGLGIVGFTAAGTAAGSLGAKMMALYGGKIVAGSAVSLMQSAGAAGIGVAGKALGGAVVASTAYVFGGGKCDPKMVDFKEKRRPKFVNIKHNYLAYYIVFL